MKRHKSVDGFIAAHPQWDEALARLREILLKTSLEETVKWGAPVYAFQGKNVVGLGAFKSYVGLWFFQGALLEDEAEKLINAQEGRTVAMRQWRFSEGEKMDENLILAYVNESIENFKVGREIKAAKNKPLHIPLELKKALTENTSAKQQFEAFGLAKKREYAEYIMEAKQEATKIRRLEKILPMIEEGKGLNDKYR